MYTYTITYNDLKNVKNSLGEVTNNSNNFKTVIANIYFTNGKGTYTNNFITTNSKIIASRILTSSGISAIVAGTKSYNGYCEIFYNSNSANGTDSIIIMIDNR